jgi:hypothetical protein
VTRETRRKNFSFELVEMVWLISIPYTLRQHSLNDHSQSSISKTDSTECLSDCKVRTVFHGQVCSCTFFVNPAPDANAQNMFVYLRSSFKQYGVVEEQGHRCLCSLSTSSYSFSFRLTTSSACRLTNSLSSRTSTCSTSHSSSSSGSSNVAI